MKTNTILRRISCLIALLLIAQTSTHAATVNIVHGIDGRDIGTAKALPVDIAVNGSCSLRGVNFTQSALVELAPATYTVTVHPADGSCTQAPVITQSILIANDGSSSYSAVASLSRSGAPQLVLFNNSRDLAITPAISLRHLAKAGGVSVTIRSREIGAAKTARIRNGQATNLSVLGDRFTFSATISANQNSRALARVTGTARRRFLIYNVVGSAKNGFTVISESLRPQS
jgi:hypothetical protein